MKWNNKNKEIKNEITIIPTIDKESIYKKIVNCTKVNLREKPNAQSKVLSVLDAGSTVQVLEENIDGYANVVIESGVEGYIKLEFVG